MRPTRISALPASAANEAAHIEPDEGPLGEAPLGRSLANLAEQVARFSPECCGAIATLTDAGAGGTATDDGRDGAGGPGTSAFPPPGADTPVLGEGGDMPLAVTHPDLAGLVAVQRECGEGPIPTALETGLPAGGDDLLYVDRWPEYRARALEAGVRSSATLPYRRDGLALTLTVCSFRPYRLEEDVRSSTALLGDLAASVLARDVRYQAALEEVEQLDSALRSRPVVDRACGIVMAVVGCDEDEAFGLLRRLSQRTNRKLSALAEGVVRSRGKGVEDELRKLRGSMP